MGASNGKNEKILSRVASSNMVRVTPRKECHMTEQRISYAGERVYVGVDVHKETYTVTCVCHTQIVKTATVPAEPASLAASLLRWFPGATLTSAYEAGFSAFVWHRALTQVGITNIVVNPASIAVAQNDKVKTDRRDSKRLAIDLADGRLRGIYIPTEAEELARLLPRTRAQIVEHRATIARQIKAKLHQFGLIAPSRRRLISTRYLREIATWPLPPGTRCESDVVSRTVALCHAPAHRNAPPAADRKSTRLN